MNTAAIDPLALRDPAVREAALMAALPRPPLLYATYFFSKTRPHP